MVGAKTDSMHGTPIKISGNVRSISDGKFQDHRPTHGGYSNFDNGTSVRIDTDNAINEGLPAIIAIIEKLPVNKQLQALKVLSEVAGGSNDFAILLSKYLRQSLIFFLAFILKAIGVSVSIILTIDEESSPPLRQAPTGTSLLNRNLIESLILILTFLIFRTSILSATTLMGLLLIFKFLILIKELDGTILPFHLLGLKGLIGVIAIFFEFNDKIGP